MLAEFIVRRSVVPLWSDKIIYFTLSCFFVTNDKAFRKDNVPRTTTIKNVISIYSIILGKMKDKLARKHEFICIQLTWAGHFKFFLGTKAQKEKCVHRAHDPLWGYRNIWKDGMIIINFQIFHITHEILYSQCSHVKWPNYYGWTPEIPWNLCFIKF